MPPGDDGHGSAAHAAPHQTRKQVAGLLAPAQEVTAGLPPQEAIDLSDPRLDALPEFLGHDAKVRPFLDVPGVSILGTSDLPPGVRPSFKCPLAPVQASAGVAMTAALRLSSDAVFWLTEAAMRITQGK